MRELSLLNNDQSKNRKHILFMKRIKKILLSRYIQFEIFFSWQVYVYDPTDEEDETKGCCLRIRKIWEEFPPLDGERQIEGDLDAVYYSYNDTTIYFFKGEDVWKNELFHPRQKQIKNGVKYVGNWFAHWYDICDVRPTFSNFEIPSNSHV